MLGLGLNERVELGLNDVRGMLGLGLNERVELGGLNDERDELEPGLKVGAVLGAGLERRVPVGGV